MPQMLSTSPRDLEAAELDLASLNSMFETADPVKVVDWTVAQFRGPNVVMSSSFGADSAVLLHMATQVLPDIKIIFVNTGYLFPQTHAHMEALRLRLHLNVWTYRTGNDPIAYLHTAGETNPAWRQDIDRCCGINKNEPFERAMRELMPKAWLRGIRRGQAQSRQNRQFVEWSDRFNCYRGFTTVELGPSGDSCLLEKARLALPSTV